MNKPKGFENLTDDEIRREFVVYCARCNRAHTQSEVRLNRINDGQYSLCCDDNLVSHTVTTPLRSRR